jgi:uncharacterized protein (TIGR03083 family)
MTFAPATDHLTPLLPFDIYRRQLHVETTRIRELARRVDHAAPIQHIDGWTVGDVIAHLAGDFQWAATWVRTGEVLSYGLSSVDAVGADLVAALDLETDSLLAAFDTTPADRPCPSFAFRTGFTVAWWIRHQLHETTMHRWDLEAAGGEPVDVERSLAVDGVSELFEVYTRRYFPQQLDQPITFACTNAAASWRVTPLDTDGRVVVDAVPPHDPSAADVVATAEQLQLLLWNRIAIDTPGVVCHIDPTVLRRFLQGPITP